MFDDSEKNYSFSVSSFSIIKLIFIILGFYLLYLIRDILAVLFVALILASALDPWVDWMQKRKIPRSLGVVFIYFGLLLTVAIGLYLVVPPISKQIGDLMVVFPVYLQKISGAFSTIKSYTDAHNITNEINDAFGSLSSSLHGLAGGVVSTVSGWAGNFLSFFLVLVMTFYMVVEENAMKRIIWSLAPDKYQSYIIGLVNRMQKKIGLWLRGQIILSLIIFALAFLGLKILKVEYALTLALVAGFMEFVPYLGPIIAGVPAVFLSSAQSPMLALFVAILYYLIHFVESNIIVPKLMQKVVGLNPIVSITFLLIGFKLGGMIGAVLSIPVATASSVFLKDIFEKKVGLSTEIPEEVLDTE